MPNPQMHNLPQQMPQGGIAQAGSQQQKEKSKKSKLKPFLLYTVLILLGLAIAKFAFDFLTPALAPAKKQPTSGATIFEQKQTTDQKLTAIKKKITQSISSFTLNGIMMSDDVGTAIVNDRVVQVGDTVDGATVTKITLSTVELEVNGKTVVLRNK